MALVFSIKDLTSPDGGGLASPNIFVECAETDTIEALKNKIIDSLGLPGTATEFVFTFPGAEYNPLDDSFQIKDYAKMLEVGKTWVGVSSEECKYQRISRICSHQTTVIL
eukprot:gnl/MRDRNA2_/MRDRNA2_187686_c0_seq1.p1 gnl/MRDRNA2_/MRDRNA2_187686_c0~~gnl/MRDRNA2_/MRDRNA2_187686_c0_seq1.p1  ORF type:complete len:110 (-),score=10.51 gnl/MRDRNA2_/MRDRNA2_187686_c0_seq1:117-446(-)